MIGGDTLGAFQGQLPAGRSLADLSGVQEGSSLIFKLTEHFLRDLGQVPKAFAPPPTFGRADKL